MRLGARRFTPVLNYQVAPGAFPSLLRCRDRHRRCGGRGAASVS